GAFNHQDFTSLGLDAFGRFEATVSNGNDLLPQATAGTRLSSIRGNTADGFVPGPVTLTVNGSDLTVDLTQADSLGDIATILTDAIDTASPGAGSVTVGSAGLVLTGNGGNTVALADLPGGRTAESLGVRGLSSTSGVADNGADVGVRITPLTSVADLGAAIDF